MERRVGAVLHRVMRLHAAQQPPALPWAGTFHAIGARLLRDCALRIGLSESFTILDRGDAEDLMGMVRHELGQSSAKSRFPLKGTCLAIYSRVINSQAPVEDVLKTAFRGARNGRPSSRPCSAPTSRPSRTSRRWITTTCCCTGPR